MCFDSVKFVILHVLRLPDIITHPIPVKRMPGDRRIQIIKHPRFIHLDLSDDDFFCRTAIHPDCSGKLRFFHPLFQGTGCPRAGCAKQIVSASVPRRFQRLIRADRLLAKTRKSVILCQKSKYRFSCSPLCNKCGLKPCDSFCDTKSFFFQIVRKTG